MDNNVLPAVRVPTVPTTDNGDGGFITETPLVDLPPSEKFCFAWPDKSLIPLVPPIPSVVRAQLAANAPGLHPDSDVSEHESSESESHDVPSGSQEGEASETTPTGESPKASRSSVPSPTLPRFSRAFSTPVSSQLGHLRHPHRTPAVISKADGYFAPPEPSIFLRRMGQAQTQTQKNSRFQELSLELADSVQTVIQTLLQISPPHLLDPAKEQFSACSLSVPSPSIAAMLTAMKNLNYMSANLTHFVEEEDGVLGGSATDKDLPLHSPILDDFDVGEMLQSIGDVLSGFAAQSGVELVLFHGDVGMKHVSVRGDECGISSSLAYMIRQIIDTAEEGDTLEVGLLISSESFSRTASQSNSDELETRSSSRSSNSRDLDEPIRVTFELGHKFVNPEVSQENIPGPSSDRRKPNLNASFFKRLLRQVGGRIKEDLPPRLFSHGRSYELSVVLEPGSSDITSEQPMLSAEEQALRQPYVSQNIELATEPSLDELNVFVDTLKGRKVALHASVKGSFAHHLSSYLTAWGLDVSHMSTNSMDEDGMSDSTGASTEEGQTASPPIMLTDSPIPMDFKAGEEQMHTRQNQSNQPTFVIIDDNVEILRSRLVQLRSEPAFNLSLRQRPKLAAHHRPKSSPQIYRAKGLKPSFAVPQVSAHPVIIHFTSLQNYKIVKDLIHTILSTPGSSQYVPEIIVLLKPAGPRRVLTALRTAILKPIVDPFFTPIATSPCSPGHSVNPYFPVGKDNSPTQKMDRPASPRTTSDRSTRPVREQVEMSSRLPPSPLRESESLEYFSEAAEKLGTSPSSGLVIQSPDGQPAGIFFHPRGPTSRLQRRGTNTSASGLPNDTQSVVRDADNLRLPVEARRTNPCHTYHPLSDADMPQGDRPRPLSRPTGTVRHQKGAFPLFTQETVPPSEIASPLQSPGLSRVNKGSSSREELVAPMITNTAPTPPPSGQSGPRKSGSPPSSPPARGGTGGNPGTRSRFTRKGTDGPQSAPPVKKAKNSTDGSILPPVNVLIVEDNPINQTILSTFMKKKKIKYDVAKNGAEAVAKWKTGGFHLILMDIQMPVMDGIEATKEIRKLEGQRMGNQMGLTPPLEGQQTPSDMTNESKSTGVQTPFRSSVIIVALTASSLQVDRVTALAAGCNDFLTKPVSLQWLNNKIIEWGSIKALQMWADLRPEVVKSIASGQATQAKNVADKLKVPEKRKSTHQASSKTAPSVVEAMRRLSINPSPSRSAASKEGDTPDSDRSDADRSPAPPIKRGIDAVTTTGKSEATNPVGELFARDAVKKLEELVENKESPSYRTVSGEEALRSHIADQAAMISSAADADATQRPIILGERSLSDPRPSIAEVMYEESKTGGSQTSSPESNQLASSETSNAVEVEVAPEGTPTKSPPQSSSK